MIIGVIGSGGREHAISAEKIFISHLKIEKLYCIPWKRWNELKNSKKC